ncbi:MAG: DUF4097 family beta strand repeat-containing protein [Planctomycetota bacterium]
MNRHALAAALSGSALVLGGCVLVVAKDSGTTSVIAGEQFVHSWSIELDDADLASHPSLGVINPSGDVTVVRTDGAPRIRIDTYSRDRDRARGMTITPRVMSDATLAIEPHWPGGIRTNESCDIAVYVPVRTGVSIEVGAGEVEVSGMAGQLTVDTGAGDIEITSHDGTATLTTNAGDIEATGVAGATDAKTNAGDIEVTLWHGFAGTLRGETRAGSIDLPGSGSRTTANGVQTATHRIGDPDVAHTAVFRTSAGDIDVRVLAPEG